MSKKITSSLQHWKLESQNKDRKLFIFIFFIYFADGGVAISCFPLLTLHLFSFLLLLLKCVSHLLVVLLGRVDQLPGLDERPLVPLDVERQTEEHTKQNAALKLSIKNKSLI